MIQKERLLDLFGRLVAIDSPSLGEREVADLIKTKLIDLGISPQEDDSAVKTGGNCGNIYAYIDGAVKMPPLLFSAHMDTVEPSCGKKMKIDENGTITSDGTTVLGADDFAGIAAILEALTTLKESDLPHRPIELLFTAAEEIYSVGLKQFDIAKLKSREAYVFDLTGPVGSAAYQAPTIISFKAVFNGRAAHAGFAPEKGIHAVKAAAEAVTRIVCGRIGDVTVNVGAISGGGATNIVPDRCAVTGEIRSNSDEKAHRKLDEISDIIRKTAEINGASVEFESTTHITAYRTDLEHPVVKRFQDACKQMNLRADLQPTFGGSDHNLLALHGISGIVLATAMNNCHSCTEYTSEQEICRAAELALALMTAKQ
ncbi:MAG TPA: M20/M25/M40 family metallo-hydrolase [Oscillospiraceae bacterium]|nr:M20/M25/M40 family metallo-hydrolase [Oscillospiraceae bacterium]HPF55916.1 M20/M25/M40 family metallo-hydrolase [Clostridiales bacterium]HPK35248.1 M20/M25/M40 family metallo-hydrolase [Oscillospiraceae bacterium]HPR75441.1 M20/M25/M40 family metallo-hydrolase [Oscillospiraceae bacterium]